MINLKLDKKLFNEVYLPYITSYEHRYEVLYGSARLGEVSIHNTKTVN